MTYEGCLKRAGDQCLKRPLIRNCFFGLMLMMSHPIFSAAFSTPSSLINIPIASVYRPGEIEFGMSSGIYSYGKYENDFKLNYNISEKFIAGFTWANSENVVGNLHSTFFNFEKNALQFRLGGGLLYITSNQYISSWDEYSSNKVNTMANYLVSTLSYKNKVRFHLGRGKKRFETKNKTEGILGSLQELGGVFFGFDFPILGGVLMGEFDGSDLNFGYKAQISEKIELNLALTEMFMMKSINPETQAPVRYFTFSFSWRENIFKSYENKLNEAGREIKSLYGMVKLFEDQKKEWGLKEKERRHNESIDKEVATLYSQAIESELKGSPDSAVIFLKKAAHLDPENPQIQWMLTALTKKEVLSEWTPQTQVIAKEGDVVTLFESAFKKEALGDYEAAIALIKQAISLNPSSATLYLKLGDLYKLTHQDDLAIKTWEEALRRSEEGYLLDRKIN